MTTTEVKPGQVWKYNDTRTAATTFTVLRLGPKLSSWEGYAEVETNLGRVKWIRLNRFIQTRIDGYTLVKDVETANI